MVADIGADGSLWESEAVLQLLLTVTLNTWRYALTNNKTGGVGVLVSV